uniref:Histidine--tRNA ligase n=1 Tax=candidate division WOR-3 bacterium TaxID=2052148 RepID=A0A7C2K0V3_UNCW3
MSAKFQRPRGTRDILPEEEKFRDGLIKKARRVLESYGYTFIITPTFEYAELFSRSIGTSTDIVEKEMFVFQDRGERVLALRPEGTASIIRAFLENQIHPPAKLAYVMNMFRAERPQRGRYREFWQIGAEALGIKDPLLDAEVIEMAVRILKEMGLENFQLEINSIGTPEEREIYKRTLLDYIEEKELMKELALCESCNRRKTTNILRILDCEIDAPKLYDAPVILEFLSRESYRYFEDVQSYLNSWGIEYTINPKLVRGLDYYTHTVFEIKVKELGAQDTVCGGGRYDRLVEELGGPATPAMGFAIGLDRVVVAMENAIPKLKGPFYFVATVGEVERGYGIRLLKKLRDWYIPSDMCYELKSLKAQLKIADRIGAQRTVIVGEDEIMRGKVRVRNMETGEEIEVDENELKAIYEKETSRNSTT